MQYFSDGRIVHEKYFGTNEKGNGFQNSFHYEYEDDEDGNWLIRRQLRDGKVVFTTIRTIEYW